MNISISIKNLIYKIKKNVLIIVIFMENVLMEVVFVILDGMVQIVE